MATSAYLPQGWAERAATVRSRGMGAVADAVLARWFTPDFAAAHSDVVAPHCERFVRMEPRSYATCCGAIGGMDLRPSNASIAAPMLIVAGADAPATPVAMMEEVRGRIPDAELVVLPRAAHLLSVERADAVNAHLGLFVGRLQATRMVGPAA